MFDQWDHTPQDGNDTETNVIIVALCVGVALSIAGVLIARIRAMSTRSDSYVVAPSSVHGASAPLRIPIPTISPPLSLRI
jgi:hypothetical protein